MTRVGVLASGSGSNVQALLDACADPDFPAEISVVISNRKRAGALERARAAGVPAEWVPRFRDKGPAEHDGRLVSALRAHGVEWVCLAGYMLLVTDVLLSAFPDRILNVHPALLPAFKGLSGAGQAVEHGVRVAGCTVHLVTLGMDEGPVVCQGAVPVLPDDDAETLQARIQRVEHQLFPRALKWAAEGRIRRRGRRVLLHPAPTEPAWLFLSAPESS